MYTYTEDDHTVCTYLYTCIYMYTEGHFFSSFFIQFLQAQYTTYTYMYTQAVWPRRTEHFNRIMPVTVVTRILINQSKTI